MGFPWESHSRVNSHSHAHLVAVTMANNYNYPDVVTRYNMEQRESVKSGVELTVLSTD